MELVNTELLPWKNIIVCDETYLIFEEYDSLFIVPKYKDVLFLKECFDIALTKGNDYLLRGICDEFSISYKSARSNEEEPDWPYVCVIFYTETGDTD